MLHLSLQQHHVLIDHKSLCKKVEGVELVFIFVQAPKVGANVTANGCLQGHA